MSAVPIGAKNAEQLLGQHDIAILPTLAAADVNHHPGTVDVLDGERDRFRHAQASGIDRHERGSELKVTHGLQKTFDLALREHGWQCIRPASQRNVFGHSTHPERRFVKEPQGAHDLVAGLHSEAAGRQMKLILSTCSNVSLSGDRRKKRLKFLTARI